MAQPVADLCRCGGECGGGVQQGGGFGGAFQGEGGDRDPLQAARWAKLAADKGDADAQALLGHLLFEGDGVPRQPVLGLMYLTIARSKADPTDRWIFDMQERAVSIATENERRTAMALAGDWEKRQ